MRRATRAARVVGRQVEEALADAVPVDATPSLVVGLVLAGLPVLLTLFIVLTTVL